MSESESQSRPGDELVTAAALARVLGLSPARVSQLKLVEGLPYLKTGAGDRFRLAESVQWYFARYAGLRCSARLTQ
jgi:phage terminase Nu1 subunit (DNA packaging protein)